jgi:dTMP kinase
MQAEETFEAPLTAPSNKGKLIVIEGIDGTGKTSIVQELALRHGWLAVRQPGGSRVGEAIRGIVKGESVSPQADLLLFAAAHADVVDTVVRPALEAGRSVIFDRWSPISGLAYQVFMKGVSMRLYEAVYSNLESITPDIVIEMLSHSDDIENRMGKRSESSSDHWDKMAQGKRMSLASGYIRAKKNYNPGYGQQRHWFEVINQGRLEEVINRVEATILDNLFRNEECPLLPVNT